MMFLNIIDQQRYVLKTSICTIPLTWTIFNMKDSTERETEGTHHKHWLKPAVPTMASVNSFYVNINLLGAGNYIYFGNNRCQVTGSVIV